MAAKPTKVPVIPKPFKGLSTEDPEKYLIQFERVATCNNWDEDNKKKYFPVYLEGTANLWFQDYSRKNNIATTTWLAITTAFRAAFMSVAKIEVAERRLSQRKQTIGESAEDYLYDMLDLCHAVDDTMQEAKVVRYIIKGLRPTFLEKVNLADPKTISELLEVIRKIHETKYLINSYEGEVNVVQQQPNDKLVELMEKLSSLMVEQNNLLASTQTKQYNGLSTQRTTAFQHNQAPRQRYYPRNPTRTQDYRQDNQQCQICRYRNHVTANCYFAAKPCPICKQLGHVARFCRIQRNQGN